MNRSLRNGATSSRRCSKKMASNMLSDDLREHLALTSTTELLEIIGTTIKDTQTTIEILTEEINLRLMEQAEE